MSVPLGERSYVAFIMAPRIDDGANDEKEGGATDTTGFSNPDSNLLPPDDFAQGLRSDDGDGGSMDVNGGDGNPDGDGMDANRSGAFLSQQPLPDDGYGDADGDMGDMQVVNNT